MIPNSPTPADIATARQSAKLTQTAFGDLAGVGRSLVCQWESGGKIPRRRTIALLNERLAERAEK